MKKRRIITSVIALMMTFSSVSMVACGTKKPGGEGVDKNRTQLYVGFYEGGWGREWMEYLKAEFEKQYPDVQIMPTGKKYEYESDLLISSFKDGINDMYFTNIYSHDYVRNGDLLLDVTDVVTTPLNEVFASEITLKDGTKVAAANQAAFETETKSIEEKMDADMRTYYKSSSSDGTKYYGIPHSGSTMNLNYDVDLFEEQRFYISSYDADAEEYIWTGGLAGQPKKWAGQDGKEGTYDDGLPVTYEDFKALCREIDSAGCVPLTYGKTMSQYRERYLAGVWANYVGADEFALGYSQRGHSEELDIDINADNAYRLQESEGKKAMLTLAYDFVKNGWLSANTETDTYTEAQNNFINSKYYAEKGAGKRIAMILEGSWWENEAKATLEGNKTSGRETIDRRFGVMTLPQFKGTAGIADQTSTDKTVVVGSSDVGIYIKKNTERADIAKKFMAFAILEANLRETTRLTGEVKPYDYQLTTDDLSSMSYYKQTNWDNLKGEGVVRTRQVGPSNLMKNNRTYFSYEWVCEAKSTNGGDWTDPFRFFGTTANSGKSVDDYWNALKTYHANNWSKLAK